MAYGSSVYQGHVNNWGPQLAIDHHVSSIRTGYFHSAREAYPYLYVDFGVSVTIGTVNIVHRKDCCLTRFHDVEIRIGDVPIVGTGQPITVNDLCTFVVQAYQQTTFTCEGGVKRGRYLSIQIKSAATNEILQINEVTTTGKA